MNFAAISARTIAAAAFLLGASVAALAQSATGIYTHHNDYWRTGWNKSETILSPDSIVASTNNFGVIATINNLDNRVDAQPLIAPNVQITCPPNQTIITCQSGLSGLYNVVYVATYSNTVYAINADNGEILLQRNFGKFVGSCGGIKSTPVIDPASGKMYVITHTTDGAVNGQQIHTLHALNVGNLMDSVTPFIISYNTFHTLTDGTFYRFDASAMCQKSALLLVGGRIYAGFRGEETSLGSISTLTTKGRGWLLQWTASTLAPLPPLLTNVQVTAANNIFLTSIWMSGSGIASDGSNLYFTTGNSDFSGTSYDPVNNVEMSVVKVTSNLTIASIFTPSNFASLDATDTDVGAGGVLAIPNAPLLVAAGGDGRMFLLSSASLGGYTPGGPDHVLDMHNIVGCWCAPSYFMDPDGIGRVVSSGGNSVITWKIMQTGSPPTPHLVQDGVAQIPLGISDPGFFTSVSSNGTLPNHSGIIWAVGRPPAGTTSVTLYAFDATSVSGTLPLLGQYPAGIWTEHNNANTVPVVANGKVYVVGSGGVGAGTLTIFGFKP